MPEPFVTVVLSRMEYRPERKVVGLDRFELSASSLSGTRSNQLSYKPVSVRLAQVLVETIGIEPTTSALQRRRSPN